MKSLYFINLGIAIIISEILMANFKRYYEMGTVTKSILLVTFVGCVTQFILSWVIYQRHNNKSDENLKQCLACKGYFDFLTMHGNFCNRCRQDGWED